MPARAVAPPAHLRIDPDLLHLDRGRRPGGGLCLEEDHAVLEPEPRAAVDDLGLRPPAEPVRIAEQRVDAELVLVRGGADRDEQLEIVEGRGAGARSRPAAADRRSHTRAAPGGRRGDRPSALPPRARARRPRARLRSPSSRYIRRPPRRTHRSRSPTGRGSRRDGRAPRAGRLRRRRRRSGRSPRRATSSRKTRSIGSREQNSSTCCAVGSMTFPAMTRENVEVRRRLQPRFE